MKHRMIFFSTSIIVALSMCAGLTASTAQSVKPAVQPQDSLTVPLWRQVNLNGFGDPMNEGVLALEIFNDRLYAASDNYQIGAKVWRMETNGGWTAVSEPGFGSAYGNNNAAIPDMATFNGNLYAGTAWHNNTGQMWRTPDGMTWSKTVADGFGYANNLGVSPFGTFEGFLYTGTYNPTDGLDIWRSATGNLDDWHNVVTGGKGNPNNELATSFIEYGGYFYAAIENHTNGVEIWRTDNGSTWSTVSSGGFGDADNTQTGGMTIFGSYLYVGTLNDVTGAQLFRSTNGTTWVPVIENGFGDVKNIKIEMVYAWNGNLYAGTQNNDTGIEIWQSSDGLIWKQINSDGFYDKYNTNVLWNSSTIEYHQNLYIGTDNKNTGGEIWQRYFGFPVYLPVVKR
jgi:flagellin